MVPRAAEQGDASAQSNLGAMYANGQAPQKYTWRCSGGRLAAEQGCFPPIQSGSEVCQRARRAAG
ncbi:MAG: hypothetical protein ACYYK0_01585 [Candidatus Eutrophobiaceae bacterium]